MQECRVPVAGDSDKEVDWGTMERGGLRRHSWPPE